MISAPDPPPPPTPPSPPPNPPMFTSNQFAAKGSTGAMAFPAAGFGGTILGQGNPSNTG